MAAVTILPPSIFVDTALRNQMRSAPPKRPVSVKRKPRRRRKCGSNRRKRRFVFSWIS